MADPADVLRSTFGDELRRWRDARRFSQLALAAAAGVSQRHLSFLETGRSKPSRDMVLHLAHTLELPLRAQNVLLATAGYSPEYTERPLDDPELDEVRRVLQTALDGQLPFPARVVDREWDIVLANAAWAQLALLCGIDVPVDVGKNALRLCLHPDGIRPAIVDWEPFALSLIHRLEREAVRRPFDERLGALVAEVQTYPGIADLPDRVLCAPSDDLMVPIVLETVVGRLQFVSMTAVLGAPFDITIEELHIETLLPADRHTEYALRGTIQK
jgi:transcriptional regulator with XRE-family HTH domain